MMGPERASGQQPDPAHHDGRQVVAGRPPRIAAALLSASLPAELRDDVLGDLQDGFHTRQSRGGNGRRWYWCQALRSLRHLRGGPPPEIHAGRRAPRLQRPFMGFRHDVGYALRQLRASPGFTAVAILSLALGIGVNTTIFTVINGFLFKPLPVADIDEVVEIYTTVGDVRHAVSSYPDYVDYRDGAEAFKGMAASMTMLFNWNTETHSQMIFGEMVSGNYFDVMGVDPAHGREFLPEEDGARAATPVVVLGHAFWQRSFGGDPAAVGGTIKLNGAPFTIVGVAPADFTGTMPVLRPDLWTPLANEPIVNFFDPGNSLLDRRGGRSLRVYGRLRDGAAIEQARSQLEVVAARLAAEYPRTNESRSVNLKPLREVRLHPEIDAVVTPIAGLLMALVGMVLLVACANVANLLLARASARSREIGVRLALGSSRWRLVRQLLTEAVILSLIGAAAALLMTGWLAGLLARVQPPIPITIGLDVSPDGRVFAFALATALLTAIVFGLAPALRASRPDLVATLRGDGTSRKAQRRFDLGNTLVVAQIAVSMVLLVGAALFIRSLGNAHAIELGFDHDNIAFVSTGLNAAGYEYEEGLQLIREVVERLEAMPGVVSAAYASRLPMNLTVATQGFFIEGHEPPGDDPSVSIEYNEVGPGYFETLHIPIVAGREIATTDDGRGPLVAVVNETLANEYWPGESPLGKRLKFDAESDPWIEVVGVSADYKMRTVGEAPAPLVHLSMAQHRPPFQTILVRTLDDPAAMVARVRQELQVRNTNISFFDARTMEENLAVVLFPMRMGAALLAVFGALALGLAAVGVYGVIGYAVSRRTREIGIRMALGARPGEVLRLVVGQGMMVVGAGMALGLLGSVALSTVVGSMLYGVSSVDPIAFLGTAIVLAGVALLANFIPARRGARVDPMVALRAE